MSGQVSRGSIGEYQADERAGVAGLSWLMQLPTSTHRDTALPGDPLPAQALGSCISFTLFSGAQDWGGWSCPNLSLQLMMD